LNCPPTEFSISPRFERTLSRLISSYERKLVQELVKPVGATKKPQDSMLNNFTANCANLEPIVLFSIIYYVIRDENTEWISKLVSL